MYVAFFLFTDYQTDRKSQCCYALKDSVASSVYTTVMSKLLYFGRQIFSGN